MFMQNGSNKTGIYFLIVNGNVNYIGQTHDLVNRLFQHKIQLMPWDDVRFIECDESKLTYYETRWIKRFKPRENKTHKGRKKHYKTLPKVESIKYFHMKFRKLTRLSRIGFGSYHDRTVESLLKMGRQVDLCQMYFNLSHITFFDDILDELKISGEWRITKPGTNKDFGRDFTHSLYPEEMEVRRENAMRYNYKNSKNKLKQIAIKDNHKAYHQSFNQKH